MLADTIAAIATGRGVAAIGVVRVSGPQAGDIAERVFRSRHRSWSREAQSHRLYRGYAAGPDGSRIDDVLAVIMRAPHSYTGEDVVEFHCHGNPVILQAVLAALLSAGARAAEPGEFTRRAFVNGKLDLVQVEAVGDLLFAGSAGAAGLAVEQLAGAVRSDVAAMRDTLIGFLAHVHGSIDYPEEVPDVAPEAWLAQVREMLAKAEEILASAQSGIRVREGVDTVIVGRPNVGKSSLLNALLRQERVIVTDIPGTTRDVVEEAVEIAGTAFRLSDTAGLRPTDDVVEQAGVERTKAKLAEAELVLAVFDSSAPLQPEDYAVLEAVQGLTTIAVWNKCDLPVQLNEKDFAQMPVVRVSALRRQGIEALEAEMARAAGVEAAQEARKAGKAVLTRARQVGALAGTVAALRRALAAAEAGVTPDCLASELEDALWHLGELTGETTPEDVVNEIFRRFCVGK